MTNPPSLEGSLVPIPCLFSESLIKGAVDTQISNIQVMMPRLPPMVKQRIKEMMDDPMLPPKICHPFPIL